MQVEVSQEILRQALTTLTRAGNGFLRLSAGKDGLQAELRDQALDLSLLLPARVEAPGEAAVPGALLARLIRAAPAGELSLERRNGHLTLRAGSFTTELATAGAETLPPAREAGSGETRTLPGMALATAIGRVLYATAQEEYQAIFRGVQLEFHPDRFRAVATDGFRLALFDTPLPEPTEGEGPVIRVLPRAAAGLLAALAQDEESVKLTFDGEGRFVARGKRFRLAGGLMEGSFPDYERVLPQAFAAEVTIGAGELREALERLAPLADGSFRVDLAPMEEELHLQVEGDYGRGQETLPARVEGERFVAAFNLRFLKEALKGVEGEAVLRLSGPQTPAILEPEEADGYRAVVVPLRVA